MEAISCRSLRVNFGSTEVLRGIDLVVPKGGWTTVVGPNGSGKTMCADSVTVSAMACEVIVAPETPSTSEALFNAHGIEVALREETGRATTSRKGR